MRSEFGVCSADLWKDPIHTPLNLLLLGRAGLLAQGISAPGITWVPSVAGGVPGGDGQRFGTGRRCRNLPTLGAAQCPSVQPGTGTVVFIFFFPIDIVSLQSFYWEIPSIKKRKKKIKFSWLKQEQFLVVWLVRLQLCAGGAPMALRLFGISWVSSKCSGILQGAPHGFVPQLMVVVRRFAHHQRHFGCSLIGVYPAINTLLFISALSTSPRAVGSFLFLKCFWKKWRVKWSYFWFCFKKKHPERQIICLFCFISRRRCWGACKPLCKTIPGKEPKGPEIRYNSTLIILW